MTFEGDKLRESRNYFDMLQLLQQVGAMEPGTRWVESRYQILQIQACFINHHEPQSRQTANPSNTVNFATICSSECPGLGKN